MRLANRIRVLKVGSIWGWACDEHTGPDPRVGSIIGWDRKQACGLALWHWEQWHAWRLQGVCPRCANNLPSCRDLKPDGRRWTHQETCEQYEWAAEVCARCAEAMEAEESRGAV